MLLRLLHRNSGVLHVARKRKSKGWKEGGKEQSAGILHAHPRDRSLMKSSRAPDFSVNLYRLIPQHFFFPPFAVSRSTEKSIECFCVRIDCQSQSVPILTICVLFLLFTAENCLGYSKK